MDFELPSAKVRELPGFVTFDLPRGAAGQWEAMLKDAEKHGGYLRLRVSSVERPRSTGKGSQNHHIWAHAAQIGSELGYDRREMLYVIASMTPEWPMRDIGGVMVPVSEAGISSFVASKAIDMAHWIAAENNITLKEE